MWMQLKIYTMSITHLLQDQENYENVHINLI